MAKVLVLGGGFGGVVAAERLAEQLSDEHQITLVSRSRQFVFYPALVSLAFGKCEIKNATFDLRQRKTVNRGLFRSIFCDASTIDLATSSARVTSGGVKITISESTFSSLPTISIASR